MPLPQRRALAVVPEARLAMTAAQEHRLRELPHQLAERAGVSASSSGYTNNLGALRSLGLLDYPQAGWVAAEPILFLEEALA